MRARYVAVTLVLAGILSLTGCAKGRSTDQPVQAPSAKAPTVVKSGTPVMAGDQAALSAALAERSTVRFEIVVSDEPAEADKDAALESLLKERNWPEPSAMVFMVFPKANNDLRFAMGADFFQKKVGVDEVLNLVRSLYFTKAKAGDPAAGLADLVRAVNQRMAQ